MLRARQLLLSSVLLMAADPALAKRHQSPTEMLIGFALIAVLGIVTFVAVEAGQQRLEDPNDKTAVYLDQLPNVSALSGSGIWHVTIIRQSGNIERTDEVRGSGEDALRRAMSTFRRAKIPGVFVQENTASVLRFSRMFHDHRGSSEGKKVGRIEIRRVA